MLHSRPQTGELSIPRRPRPTLMRPSLSRQVVNPSSTQNRAALSMEWERILPTISSRNNRDGALSSRLSLRKINIIHRTGLFRVTGTRLSLPKYALAPRMGDVPTAAQNACAASFCLLTRNTTRRTPSCKRSKTHFLYKRRPNPFRLRPGSTAKHSKYAWPGPHIEKRVAAAILPLALKTLPKPLSRKRARARWLGARRIPAASQKLTTFGTSSTSMLLIAIRIIAANP